jgi:hypothetical protein
MADVSTVQEPFVQLLSGVGVSGVTALLAYLWVKKDNQYTDLANKITTAFEKNTEVSTKLQETISANTKATEKLETTITNQLFEILRDSNK